MTRRGRLGVAALTAIAGALAAGAAIALLLAGGTRVTVAGNTVVTPAGPGSLPDSLTAESNSPSIVRNPTRHHNLAVVNRLDRFRQGYSAALHWSDNGGASWHHTALPLPPGRDRPFAPDVAFGPDGTLYVSYVNLEGVGNDPQTLWVSSSTDGGRTLSAPSRVSDHLPFQARLAVDRQGTLCVTWLQAMQVGTLSITGPPSPIVLSRSTDGGRTFSTPVRVSDSDRTRVGAASIAIDSEGGIDVLYEDFKNDVRDFENLEGPAWDHPFALVLTRSIDGGRTFSRGGEVDDGLVATERFLVYLPVSPAITAGPGGSLYVAWADARNGHDNVFLRASRDAGASWTPAVRVSDNRAGDTTKQWMPSVEVAPGGRVDVAFLDRPADPRRPLTSAHLATSDDGGRTFRDTPISTAPFDSRIGSSAAAHLSPDLGSRTGLVSEDSGAEVVWTDTRLGTLDTGRQDIMSARVDITQRSRLWAALTAIAGSILFGMALGLARGASRLAES